MTSFSPGNLGSCTVQPVVHLSWRQCYPVNTGAVIFINYIVCCTIALILPKGKMLLGICDSYNPHFFGFNSDFSATGYFGRKIKKKKKGTNKQKQWEKRNKTNKKCFCWSLYVAGHSSAGHTWPGLLLNPSHISDCSSLLVRNYSRRSIASDDQSNHAYLAYNSPARCSAYLHIMLF